MKSYKIIYFFIFITLIFYILVYNSFHIHNIFMYSDEFEKIKSDINLTNTSITQFSRYLELNYNYSSFYDCKFYSFIWIKYSKLNELNSKYIFVSNNHVMTSIYNDTRICLSNLHEVNCYN